MAKIKYNKTKGLHSVLRKSVPIESVAGENYEKFYTSVRQEIKRKDSQYAAAFSRASKIRVGGETGASHLKPDVEYAIRSIAEDCEKNNESVIIGGIDLIKDVFPICLSSEGNAEPVAQYLAIEQGRVISRKPSNIFFHPYTLFDVIGDLMLFAPEVPQADIIQIIIKVFKLFFKVCANCEIPMDETCAKIVLMLSELSNNQEGVEEEILKERFLQKYPELSEKEWQVSEDVLIKYNCIGIEDGKAFFKESIR